MNTEQLIRYIEGNSTQAEKEIIAEWLDEDAKNRKEFTALRKSYDYMICNLKEELCEQPIEDRKKKTIIYELLKIAAIFTLAVGCSYLFYFRQQQNNDIVMNTFHVPAGQRAELTLADGTHVWLNAETTLTFPNHFSKSKREVVLNGEAYFNVKHDPSNAFVVQTDKYAIKVLGTEFNVISYDSNEFFETALIKGSVEIASLRTREAVRLTPENRVYCKNGRLIKAPIEHYSHFSWKDGLLSFNDERVEGIFDKLQLYYDVEIKVENTDILDFRYTGKFWTSDGIEHVIKVLQIHLKELHFFH